MTIQKICEKNDITADMEVPFVNYEVGHHNSCAVHLEVS